MNKKGYTAPEIAHHLGVSIRRVNTLVKNHKKATVSKNEFHRKYDPRKSDWKFGAAPYGFVLLDGRLVADPKEQRVLKIIRKLHSENLGFAPLARRLNEQGIRPRQGKQWNPSSIFKIIKRERENEYQ